MFEQLKEAASLLAVSAPGTIKSNAHEIDVHSGTYRMLKGINIPHRPRSSDVAPRLFADNSEYTYGTGKRQEAYQKLIQQYRQETDNEDASAILEYLLRSPQPPEQVRAEPSLPVTFSVNGKNIISPQVIAWWQEFLFQRNKTWIHCAVCGNRRPQSQAAHPKIVGLPASHRFGAALSAVWQGEDAPICGMCGATVANTLNFLLASPQHHCRLGTIMAVFWSTPNSETSSLVLRGNEAWKMDSIPTHGSVCVYLIKDNEKRLAILGTSSFDLETAHPYLVQFQHVQEEASHTPACSPLALAQHCMPFLPSTSIQVSCILSLIEYAFSGRPLLPWFHMVIKSMTPSVSRTVGIQMATLLTSAPSSLTKDSPAHPTILNT